MPFRTQAGRRRAGAFAIIYYRDSRERRVRSLLLHMLKPNIGPIGYALFLAVNATGIWGGVFPFLPLTMQTHEIMFWFYLSQSVALFVTLFLLARATYASRRIGPLSPR